MIEVTCEQTYKRTDEVRQYSTSIRTTILDIMNTSLPNTPLKYLSVKRCRPDKGNNDNEKRRRLILESEDDDKISLDVTKNVKDKPIQENYANEDRNDKRLSEESFRRYNLEFEDDNNNKEEEEEEKEEEEECVIEKGVSVVPDKNYQKNHEKFHGVYKGFVKNDMECDQLVSMLDPCNKNLIFQQTSICWDRKDFRKNGRPVIHMFGRTEDGVSIQCNIHGYRPYMYFRCPDRYEKDDLAPLAAWLRRRLYDSMGVVFNNNNNVHFVSCEIVERRSIYGYSGNGCLPFIKVTLNDPWKLHELRGIIKEGSIIGRNRQRFPCDTTTYEDKLDFELRFMIDHNVTGANWIELPAGKYDTCKLRTSRCQYEVDVDHNAFISYPSDVKSDIAPLRICTFDIECKGRKGIFPEPGKDPVIQIANVVEIEGEPEPIACNVFVLNGCSAIDGADVYSFDDEKDMLMAWWDFVTKTDPDLLTGYNIANFDLWYLINRALALNLYAFTYLGRIKHKKTEIKEKTVTTQAFGTRENKCVCIPGRVIFDMYPVIDRNYKLTSYKLDHVSEHFLNERKDDVHYTEIATLQNGSDDDRARLGAYCLQDAWLPLKLLKKLMCLYNYIEMARVTGVPIQYLVTRGQQIKALSQISRKALCEGYLIPTFETTKTDEKFSGALVIDPKTGFYKMPIATLDFNSLYPSIMMAHNLCYTTLLHPDDIGRYQLEKGRDYIDTPSGHAFVCKSKRAGLLPTILRELLAARKQAKADLKKETDPFKRAVLDGRQLALKLSANSVYGFTGAQNGYLPCLQIASTVTAIGQVMIRQTIKIVEERYTVKNGYKHDAEVVYGDTDSVMINFGDCSLTEVMKLGREAAEIVTKLFVDPINLEFEKAYYPYLLIAKKRYAGRLYTNPDKHDKIDTKGIEIVRRDKCKMVQGTMKKVLNYLFDQDLDAVIRCVHEVVKRLRMNDIDLNDLLLTKQWSKPNYPIPQVHVELAKRMNSRDPTLNYGVGDRIPYVIKAGSKSKFFFY